MSGYDWTLQSPAIDRLAKLADQIEIEPCCDVAGVIERCDVSESDLYSVYFHYAPQPDPTAFQGVECVADRDTLEEANSFARTLAAQFGLPVYGVAGEAL